MSGKLPQVQQIMDKALEAQKKREAEKIREVTGFALKHTPEWAHPFITIKETSRAFVRLPECELIGIDKKLGNWNQCQPDFFVIRSMFLSFSGYIPDRFEQFEDAVAQAGIWWEEDRPYREAMERMERQSKGQL